MDEENTVVDDQNIQHSKKSCTNRQWAFPLPEHLDQELIVPLVIQGWLPIKLSLG
jgi:hypothetical protein